MEICLTVSLKKLSLIMERESTGRKMAGKLLLSKKEELLKRGEGKVPSVADYSFPGRTGVVCLAFSH